MEMYQLKRVDEFYLKEPGEASEKRCPLNWTEKVGKAEQF